MGWLLTVTETIALAEAAGLTTLVNATAGSIQAVNIASGVTWTRMMKPAARAKTDQGRSGRCSHRDHSRVRSPDKRLRANAAAGRDVG